MSRRTRDRHGRGLRGQLLPPYAPMGERQVGLPAWRTRAGRFDDLVRDALDALGPRWADELEGVEFSVEDAPGEVPPEHEGLVADDTAGGPVPLGLLTRAAEGRPARVVVFRRPLEARAEDRIDLALLVREVVVDQVAQLLGVEPEEVDPGDYRR